MKKKFYWYKLIKKKNYINEKKKPVSYYHFFFPLRLLLKNQKQKHVHSTLIKVENNLYYIIKFTCYCNQRTNSLGRYVIVCIPVTQSIRYELRHKVLTYLNPASCLLVTRVALVFCNSSCFHNLQILTPISIIALSMVIIMVNISCMEALEISL